MHEPTPPTEPTDLTQDVALPTRERAWPEPWMEGLLVAMSQAPVLSRAALHVGVSRRTVQRWMQRDEDFALAIRDAKQEAYDRLELNFYVKGLTGHEVQRRTVKTLADGSVEETVTTERVFDDNHAWKLLVANRPELRDSQRIEHGGTLGVRLDEAKVNERISALLASLGT